MRFRGLTILLISVVGGISLYHLGLTWVVYRVEKEATVYATDAKGRINYAKRRRYLHEKENKPVFGLWGWQLSYSQAKEGSLRKGKDIDGGYTFVLALVEISQLKKMMRRPNSKEFLKAVHMAAQSAQKNPGRAMTDHFCDAMEKLSKEPLSVLFLSKYLPKELGVSPSNKAIRTFLRNHMKEIIKEAIDPLRKRLSGVGGLAQVDIYQDKKGHIVVELPGDDRNDRLVAMVSKPGDLSLHIVVGDARMTEEFMKALGKLLKKGLKYGKKEKNLEVKDLFVKDSNGNWWCEEKNVAKLDRLLEQEEVMNLLHEDVRIFLDRVAKNGFRRVYFLKKGSSDIHIKSAKSTKEGTWAVGVAFDYASGKAFERLTANNLGKVLAIVIDGRVQVAALVNSKISGGVCKITGEYTLEQADDLANVLNSEMNAQLTCIEKSVIGAEFAEEEKNQSLYVLFIALLLVLLFMLLYYAVGGLVANVALLMNMIFILGILASFGAVLSLPGIAGIVLTIGMSIDAAVIIFASILAEKARGIYIVNAIRSGYSRAYRVIIDSNLTTLLTGLILYKFGTGAIRSFATTLIIGIFSSLFTSVFVTRLFIEFMMKVMDPEKISFTLFPGGPKLSKFNFDFLGKRKFSYALSLFLILGGFMSIYKYGLDRGVDFTGGRVYVCEFDAPVSIPALKAELVDMFEKKSVELKTYGANNVLRITTNYLLENNTSEADEQVRQKLIQGIAQFTGKKYVGAVKVLDRDTFSIPSNTKIMASAAEDIKASAWLAILLALLMILLYIFLSFRSIALAVAAIAALVHDTLMLFAGLGLAKALGVSYELDLVFVTSVLTILGYSINDTVVVYAYIVGLQPSIRGKGIRHLVNPAINNTLNRTLPTSITTLIPIVILYFFGGKALEPMAFSLLIGVIFGTYSSVFIAAPLAHDLMELGYKRKETDKRAH